jgi:DNA-binding response OmpR family regulator
MDATLPKILLVEDDKNMGFLLMENLKISGFNPTLCENGLVGLNTFIEKQFDLCVLDIMLPKKDGLSLASDIRKINSDVPIIFLTAKSLDEDKIAGFKKGGDDYVTKPFNIEELIFRIKAILKRKHTVLPDQDFNEFDFGVFKLLYDERKLIEGDQSYTLSAKEADLFKILLKNKNKVVARGTILKEVWGVDDYYVSKSLDVYLNKIRKYLLNDSDVEIINIHGFGYKLLIKTQNK